MAASEVLELPEASDTPEPFEDPPPLVPRPDAAAAAGSVGPSFRDSAETHALQVCPRKRASQHVAECAM